MFLDAAENGELTVIEDCLFHGTDPNYCNEDGITALHNASIGGHLDVVKLLLSKGADLNGSFLLFYALLITFFLFCFVFLLFIYLFIL